MKRSSAVAAASCILSLASTSAWASTLPAIKAGGANKVPECATPGRLMAYLAARNPKLDKRFAGIATAYMRHGEELGIRWDYAFYQMLLETGSLSYTRDGTKPGDVKPTQNNFAGLGATGKGEPGETFRNVEDGVRAHLQHLVMYSGERVEDPIAERTRKVQEWGVLTSWQKRFKKPITFSDLAAKWAPGSRGYASNVHSFHTEFHEEHCAKPDPKPELVQEARAGRATTTRQTVAKFEEGTGAELARKAIERARSEGDNRRSALGAKGVVAAKPFAGEAAPTPGLTVLNEPAQQDGATANPDAASGAALAPQGTAAKPQNPASAQATKIAAAAALPKPPPAAAAPAVKCRVYTASYGGQKAVIIRASADQFTNYTVLDVNEGQEAREVEAYIGAYAKGGQKVGEFSSSNAALDKAFQLCPEG